MKKLPSGLCFLLLLFSSGCSKIVYTQQVVDKIHTKRDLVKQLGQPDQKVKYPGFEEWVYVRDTLSALSNKNTPDTVNKVARPLQDSSKTTFYAVHHTFIKFQIDSTNRVTGYKNNGVDLTRKVKENFGQSVLTILGGTLLVLLIITLEIINDKYSN
jgi:hypothetical protein